MQNPSESRDPGKQVYRSDLKQAIERQIKNKVRGQEVGLITTMMTLAENCSKCGKKSPSDRDLAQGGPARKCQPWTFFLLWTEEERRYQTQACLDLNTCFTLML